MRYNGRVKVNKVDEKGKKITGSLKLWVARNPGKLYFDSTTEWEAWMYLKTTTVKFTIQPTLTLFNGMKTKEFKDGKIVDYTQRAIGYTPDFYLDDHKIYIEVKGFADELFKVRWKLFKLSGYEGYVVYSKKELQSLLTELKII